MSRAEAVFSLGVEFAGGVKLTWHHVIRCGRGEVGSSRVHLIRGYLGWAQVGHLTPVHHTPAHHHLLLLLHHMTVWHHTPLN